MKLFIIYAARIGHLAMNTELFLRRVNAGMLSGALVRLVDHESGEFVANQQLYEMIKRKHQVFEMTVATFSKLLESGHENAGILFSGSNEFLEFNTMPPQLTFLPEEHESGRKIPAQLGIGEKPYVCIHNRTSDYLAGTFPRSNFRHHNYRDCSIHNYMLAAEWLTTRVYMLSEWGRWLRTQCLRITR